MSLYKIYNLYNLYILLINDITQMYEPNYFKNRVNEKQARRGLYDFLDRMYRWAFPRRLEEIKNETEIYASTHPDGIPLESEISAQIPPDEAIVEAETALPTVTFPPKLILIINTHGKIPCSLNSQKEPIVNIFKVPDEIEIIKFTMSTPGIINWAGMAEINTYMNIINEYANELLHEDDNTLTMNIIIEGFKEIRNVIKKNIRREIRNANNNDDYGKDLIYHFDEGFNFFTLGSGDKVIDKIYERQVEEITAGTNDWSICEMTEKYPVDFSSMTIPVLPDLFSKLFTVTSTTPRDENHAITTRQLIGHYKNLGVKKLIIFDFSCSNFVEEFVEDGVTRFMALSKREERILRKQIYKNVTKRKRTGLVSPYGGNRRKARTKTKTNTRTKTKKYKKK